MFLAVEAELKAQGERRGGDTSSGEQRNVQNFAECSGQKTREIAAQKAGFGSADSYRRAKTAGEDIRLNLDEYSGQRTDQIAAEKAGFESRRSYRDARTVVQQGTPELVEALGERQGQRTDLVGELRLNLDEAIGRSDDIAAEKAGFSSADSYRQAKTVVQKTSHPASALLSAWPSKRGDQFFQKPDHRVLHCRYPASRAHPASQPGTASRADLIVRGLTPATAAIFSAVFSKRQGFWDSLPL